MKTAYIVLDHLFNDVCFVTYDKIDLYTFFRYEYRRKNYSFIEVKDEDDYEKFEEQLDNGGPIYIGEEIVTHYDQNVYYNTLPVTAMTILKDLGKVTELVGKCKLDKDELETIVEAILIMMKKLKEYVYKRPDIFIETSMIRDYLRRQDVISAKEYKELMKIGGKNGEGSKHAE